MSLILNDGSAPETFSRMRTVTHYQVRMRELLGLYGFVEQLQTTKAVLMIIVNGEG